MKTLKLPDIVPIAQVALDHTGIQNFLTAPSAQNPATVVVTCDNPDEVEENAKNLNLGASALESAGFIVAHTRKGSKTTIGLTATMLTAEEKTRLTPEHPQSANDPSIIAAGPIIRELNTDPYRLVLRVVNKGDGREAQVGKQNVPDGNGRKPAMAGGNWYPYNTDEDEGKAVGVFARHLLRDFA